MPGTEHIQEIQQEWHMYGAYLEEVYFLVDCNSDECPLYAKHYARP